MRDEYERVYIKDLMEAFVERFGSDDCGCFHDDEWFSAQRILEFMSDFADEYGEID